MYLRRLRVLLGCILLAVGFGSAWAGAHPVRLEKATTSAKCLECHQDKVKHRIVHISAQSDCLACHVIRNSGSVTRVVLKSPRMDILCGECHANKQVRDSTRGIHRPAVSDCLVCHDPHASENPSLLLKASSGPKGQNGCLECHNQGLNVPEKGSRHAALDSGCESCHTTHKVGDFSTAEFRYHLTKSSPTLCLDCHDANNASLQAAHKNQPFAKSDCTICHDPHQSSTRKLMVTYLHSPFADGGCDTCHEAPVDGKVKLTHADARELCVMCHDEAAKKIESAKFQHAGALGDCTACHDPHAGRYARFIKPDPIVACTNCHAQQAELHNRAALHPPAYFQSCSVCHSPHGGDNADLLRATGNDLCLTCHGAEARGLAVEGREGIVSIFGKSVVLPAIYVERAERLHLTRTGIGHPSAKHPVAGPDPSDPGKRKQISCVRCHVPHAGEKKLLVTNTANSATLCAQCHRSPEGERK